MSWFIVHKASANYTSYENNIYCNTATNNNLILQIEISLTH